MVIKDRVAVLAAGWRPGYAFGDEAGNLDGRNPAWTPPFHRSSPAATGGPNCLVGDVRRLAYDRSLAPDDAMRRIRDAFGVNDGIIIEDEAGA